MPARKKARAQFAGHSLGLIETTAEAAFASDESSRVVIWNAAAARLTGLRPEEVVGKPCYEVLQGTDPFGNRHCSEMCMPRQMIRRNEPVHAFLVQTRGASGRKLTLECSIVVVPGPRRGGHSLVHLLLPAGRESALNATQCPGAASAPLAPSDGSPRIVSGQDPPPSASSPVGPASPLTRREAQILRLTAAGHGSGEIAGLLGISPATVRNHIQNVLRKLEAHSKLQAVFTARRERLI